MPRPRLLAALLAAALAASASVLAACELFCAIDCARSAALATATHGCHETAPARPPRCNDRHQSRLAGTDSAPGLPDAPPTPRALSPAPMPSTRPGFSLLAAGQPAQAVSPPAASPPLVLRV